MEYRHRPWLFGFVLGAHRCGDLCSPENASALKNLSALSNFLPAAASLAGRHFPASGHFETKGEVYSMSKRFLAVCAFGVLCLSLPAFIAAQEPAQGDSMKSDSMKKDSMSHDEMSKDKMSQDKMAHDKMAKPLVFKGWVSDSECAAEGNKKCDNKEHIAKGAKLVLVSDADSKIYTIANPDSLAAHQGHHVQVKASADNGSLTVQDVKMLK
jgi:pentapeptide MXKDX repeat protein